MALDLLFSNVTRKLLSVAPGEFAWLKVFTSSAG